MIIRMTHSAQPILSQISFKNATLSPQAERKFDGLNLVHWYIGYQCPWLHGLVFQLNGETECENLSPAVTGDYFASTYGDMSSWARSAPVIFLCSNNERYPVQTSQMSPLIH
jgi:hypothetical protein